MLGPWMRWTVESLQMGFRFGSLKMTPGEEVKLQGRTTTRLRSRPSEVRSIVLDGWPSNGNETEHDHISRRVSGSPWH